MASFICLGCGQPVHLRTTGNQLVPPELKFCYRCEQFRAQFERDVADARAGGGMPNSDYWLDKTASEAGFGAIAGLTQALFILATDMLTV